MEKSADAFRTISEVAEQLDVPQHVLRFWESRFPQIRPMKRGGGRRYYRPDDVDLLRGIRGLLYGQGYTIRGVQKILRDEGPKHVQAIGRDPSLLPGSNVAAALDDAERHSDVDAPAEYEIGDDAALTSIRPGMSATAIERLRAVVEELGECKRLLNAVSAAAQD